MKTTTKAIAAIMLLFAVALITGFTVSSNRQAPSDCAVTDDVVWVDLGLPSGTLWADRNVGATKPEDYGNHYAWGETVTKYSYDGEAYKYYHAGNIYGLTKYCNKADFGNNGFRDKLTTLQPIDDVARQQFGGKSHTPTKEECQELIDYTTSEWTTLNGVKGCMFTSKKNGKSIFLPAGGETYMPDVGRHGCYMTSSLAGSFYSWLFWMNSNNVGINKSHREDGVSVRAVRQR